MKPIFVQLFAVAYCLASDGPNAERDRTVALARAVGLDPSNQAGLVRAVNERKEMACSVAASVLGFLPKTESAISALRSATASSDAPLVISAALALNRLGVHDWVHSAEGLLWSMGREPQTDRIALAAALAGAGDYAGWPIFRESLGDGRIDDQLFAGVIAWSSVFDNMPGPYGPRMTLAHELHELMPRLPAARRMLVQKQITRVQAATAPRTDQE
jgi:hypothetical protein